MDTWTGPAACPNCSQPYRGGQIKVEFMHCQCPGRDAGGGHLAKWCLWCGWYLAPGHVPMEGWHIEVLPSIRPKAAD